MTEETVVAPQEPVRETVGRYAAPVWSYKGKLMPWAEAALAYERDRADFWKERALELQKTIDRIWQRGPLP